MSNDTPPRPWLWLRVGERWRCWPPAPPPTRALYLVFYEIWSGLGHPYPLTRLGSSGRLEVEALRRDQSWDRCPLRPDESPSASVWMSAGTADLMQHRVLFQVVEGLAASACTLGSRPPHRHTLRKMTPVGTSESLAEVPDWKGGSQGSRLRHHGVTKDYLVVSPPYLVAPGVDPCKAELVQRVDPC